MITTQSSLRRTVEVPGFPASVLPPDQGSPESDPLARVPVSPAPWQLLARGIVLLFRPDERFATLLPPAARHRYRGGVPALMALRYLASDVGPYDELMLIPGLVAFDGRPLYSVSHVASSTLASVVNGRLNWGIPKELAPLQFENRGRQLALRGERPDGFAVEVVAEGGGLPFQLAHASLPTEIGQERDVRLFVTHPSVTGWALRARLQRLSITGPSLPSLDWATVGVALTVDRVHLHLPAAEVRPLGGKT